MPPCTNSVIWYDQPSTESSFNPHQGNIRNEDVEVQAVSLSEDVFELGAEGKAIIPSYQIPYTHRDNLAALVYNCRYRQNEYQS